MDNNGINDEDEYRPGGCYHRLSIQLHSIDSLLLLLQVLKTVSGNNKDTTQDASTILHIRASNDDDEAASSSAGGAGAGLYIATGTYYCYMTIRIIVLKCCQNHYPRLS